MSNTNLTPNSETVLKAVYQESQCAGVVCLSDLRNLPCVNGGTISPEAIRGNISDLVQKDLIWVDTMYYRGAESSDRPFRGAKPVQEISITEDGEEICEQLF